MASNVFVTFDHDDQKQVAGFKLLKNNPNHPLEFQDHSRSAIEAANRLSIRLPTRVRNPFATRSGRNSTVH